MPRKRIYIALSAIEYAPSGLRKEAGEEVTLEELREAEQSDEDVARLVAEGALEER